VVCNCQPPAKLPKSSRFLDLIHQYYEETPRELDRRIEKNFQEVEFLQKEMHSISENRFTSFDYVRMFDRWDKEIDEANGIYCTCFKSNEAKTQLIDISEL